MTRGTSVAAHVPARGADDHGLCARRLQDGSAGDLIRVRNIDSGAVIMGVVQPDGTVRVGAP